MIIQGQKKSDGNWPYFLTLILLLLALLAFRFYHVDDEKDKSKPLADTIVFCDAENVDEDSFVNDGHHFSELQTRSDEKSYSGNYSSKLEVNQLKSMTYRLQNPIPGGRYKVEIRSYNQHPVKSSLVAAGPEGSGYIQSVNSAIKMDENFWATWEMLFTAPRNMDLKYIDIYGQKTEGPNSIFFDDLKISYLGENDLFLQDEFAKSEFQITIDKEGLDKLHENRVKSFAQGLVYHDGSKVKAKIWDDGKFKKASIRHKGDWLDHLGKNASYRVDMDSEESWKGMQSFSVQEPVTRSFLWEWVFFQFLDYADVLRPRFDYIYFKQNQKDKIVFSYEEHFTKNLVESKNRREGPIVKMTEDRMWEITKRTIKGWRGSLPGPEEREKSYWSSELRAFKESKLLKNPKLTSDFEVAQNLLQQFKYNLKSTEEIFDLDRMAQYMVIVDLCLAHHAMTWHNQRFYYNPVTALLEPIGFDGYSTDSPEKYASHIYAEQLYTKEGGIKEAIDDLFFDEKFVNKYFYYLNKYTQPEFLDQFMESIEEPLAQRENFLRTRFTSYKYNRDIIKKKAIKIQIALPAHVGSLVAFRSESKEGIDYLKIANQHGFPIEILTKANDGNSSSIVYPQVRGAVPVYDEWNVATGTKQLKYKVVGLDSVHTVDILKWTTPDDWSPRQELNSTISEFDNILHDDGGNVRMVTGQVKITEPMIIPAGKQLSISSGTHLIFSDGAFLLSYSPIHLSGDPEDPITVEASDDNSGSISVIQAEGKSSLRNVLFKNQNTLAYKKWRLTGAVNFYESDVDILRTAFTHNRCEDALNIIRSEFTIGESKFSNTFADAFDSDFCKGTVSSTQFRDVGNDAIDASGSILKIAGCKIIKAGDKGISAGEQSTLNVTWTDISDANIGLASKDKSRVTIDQMKLERCNLGFTAFQKKPEYGPASIIVNNYSTSDIKQLESIQERSSIEYTLKK
jgi:hypothetical protein